MSFYLPPFGVPTASEIQQLYQQFAAAAPTGQPAQKPPLDSQIVTLIQGAFGLLRLMDLSPSTYRYSAGIQLLGAGYDFYKGHTRDAAVSVVRAIASLMGYGTHLVVADLAVTYMRFR